MFLFIASPNIRKPLTFIYSRCSLFKQAQTQHNTHRSWGNPHSVAWHAALLKISRIWLSLDDHDAVFSNITWKHWEVQQIETGSQVWWVVQSVTFYSGSALGLDWLLWLTTLAFTIELPSSSYVNVLLSCMQDFSSFLQKKQTILSFIWLGEPAVNLSELVPLWPLCSLTANINQK